MRIRGRGVSAVVVVGFLAAGGASAQVPDLSGWNNPSEPFRVVGNATPAKP
jgi:hypothetical protein